MINNRVVGLQPALCRRPAIERFTLGVTTSPMTISRDHAHEIATAFVQSQPLGWAEGWPTKRGAIRRKRSSVFDAEVWEVRSLRVGLDVSNVWVEVAYDTGEVLYARLGGGRAPDQSFVSDTTAFARLNA